MHERSHSDAMSPVGDRNQGPEKSAALFAFGAMLELYDVPDLIDALAERFTAYEIAPREARHITVEMLDQAFAALEPFEENTRVDGYVLPYKH